tara:strand:- start:210 stop:1367 length:1158 start_codon:yes stop_codon:yes gene_type:complete
VKIKLKNSIKNDKYTKYVYDKFDIQNREETITEVSFNLSEARNFDWNIGVIYGSSGSGKTTILKQMGDLASSVFDGNKSLISNFDWLEPNEASRLLSSMGLSSVPTWLRPFHLLSNGEQFRAELAYKVGRANDSDVILIDEFTSVVDRDVAKSMSFAIQKYIRKNNKRMIVASCHYDVMEWLTPDWICSPQKKGGSLERGQWLRQSRPQIELSVSRVESSTWDLFKEHHYLTEDVSKACKFFLFTWNEKPIGINAVIPQPSGHFKNGVRESRIVILPDYQGLGLGTVVSNFTASIYKDNGYRYFTKTVHPAIGGYRNKNPDTWRGTSKNGKSPKAQNAMGGMTNWNVLSRTSYCHEYIGDSLSGYEGLMKPIKEMRELKNNNLKQ